MLKQFKQEINDTRWNYVSVQRNEESEMVTMGKKLYYLTPLKYHLKVDGGKLKMCTINPKATIIIKDLQLITHQRRKNVITQIFN